MTFKAWLIDAEPQTAAARARAGNTMGYSRLFRGESAQADAIAAGVRAYHKARKAGIPASALQDRWSVGCQGIFVSIAPIADPDNN